MPDLALLLIRRGPSTPRSVELIDTVVAGFVAAGLSEDEASRTYAALTTLALARVVMPASPSLPASAYVDRPLAAAATLHLSTTEDTTVDLIRTVGAALDSLGHIGEPQRGMTGGRP